MDSMFPLLTLKNSVILQRLSYIIGKVKERICRMVPTIVKPRILEFGARGTLEIISSCPCFLRAGIKQPAWVTELEGAGVGIWSLTAVSGAVQHHLIFRSSSQQGLCPPPPSPAVPQSSVTLSSPRCFSYHCCTPFADPTQSLPQLTEGAGQSSRVCVGLRELWWQSSSDIDGCLDSVCPFLFLALRLRRDCALTY